MNQKDLSQQLGSMVAGQVKGSTGSDDCLPSELTTAPTFEVEHETEIEKARKEARKTIGYIVDAVVPEEYKNHPSIKNQIEVDAIQLGLVLYNQNMNNIMIENTMTSISTGNDNPRMYEVTEKFFKRSSELVTQITEMCAQYRKYYIDTYLDIESKNAADETEHEEIHLIESKENEKKVLGVETSDGGMRFIGKQSTEALIQQKIERAKREKQLEKERQKAEQIEDSIDAEIVD